MHTTMSRTTNRTTTARPSRPLVSVDDEPLFSADSLHHTGTVAQRRAGITVAEAEEITRRSEQAEDERKFLIPDVQTYGTVEKMTLQTDRRGAVLVAYTTDRETGAVTRSSLRFDLAGIAYLLSRLGAPAVVAAAEPCQAARCAEDRSPCEGPKDAVLILDTQNAGAYGCEHHGARLLASIPGARPVSHRVDGAALRVHKALG